MQKTWWRTKSSLRMSLFLSGGGRRELQWLLGALSSSFAGASVIPVLISAVWWYLTEHSSDKIQGQIRGMSHRCPEDIERRGDVREQKVNRKKMVWHTAFYFQHKIIFFFPSLFCSFFVINHLWLCQTYAQTMQQIKTRQCRRSPTHSNGSCFPSSQHTKRSQWSNSYTALFKQAEILRNKKKNIPKDTRVYNWCTSNLTQHPFKWVSKIVFLN